MNTYNILNRKFYECADENLIPFFSNKTILEQGKKILNYKSFILNQTQKNAVLILRKTAVKICTLNQFLAS